MAEILFFGYGSIILIGFCIAMYFAWKKLPKDSCTGDCDQGRNCTCSPNKEVTKDVE